MMARSVPRFRSPLAAGEVLSSVRYVGSGQSKKCAFFARFFCETHQHLIGRRWVSAKRVKKERVLPRPILHLCCHDCVSRPWAFITFAASGVFKNWRNALAASPCFAALLTADAKSV